MQQKNKKNIKSTAQQLLEIQNKQKEPLTMTEPFCFSNYMLFTDVIHFSSNVKDNNTIRLKLIMTDKHTRLDDKSLDVLMRISFQSEPLTPHQIKVMICNWKNHPC